MNTDECTEKVKYLMKAYAGVYTQSAAATEWNKKIDISCVWKMQ
jgi:hypothetical protein